MVKVWNSDWSELLFRVYFILAMIFLLGAVYFWVIGPIEIAQICALGLLWSVFGTLLNKVFRGKREDK